MNFFGTNYPKVGFGLIAAKCIDHGDIMTSFGQFLEILLSKYVLRSAGKGKHGQNAGTLNPFIGTGAEQKYQAKQQKAQTSSRTNYSHFSSNHSDSLVNEH